MSDIIKDEHISASENEHIYKSEKTEFKGIWIPTSLIEDAGYRLAVKLSAFHIGAPYFSLSRQDKKTALELGLLKEKIQTPCEIAFFLIKKTPQNIQNKQLSKQDRLKVCRWCFCETLVLHSHHFPIPKSQGGKQTVDICPNCHSEYHHLMDFPILFLNDPYATEIDNYFFDKEEVNQ